MASNLPCRWVLTVPSQLCVAGLNETGSNINPTNAATIFGADEFTQPLLQFEFSVNFSAAENFERPTVVYAYTVVENGADASAAAAPAGYSNFGESGTGSRVRLRVSAGLYAHMTSGAVVSSELNVVEIFVDFDGTVTFTPLNDDGTYVLRESGDCSYFVDTSVGNGDNNALLRNDFLAVVQRYSACAWPVLYYPAIQTFLSDTLPTAYDNTVGYTFFEFGVGWSFLMQTLMAQFAVGVDSSAGPVPFHYVGLDPYNKDAFQDTFTTTEVGAVLGRDPRTQDTRTLQQAFDALHDVVVEAAAVATAASTTAGGSSTATFVRGNGYDTGPITSLVSAGESNVVFIDGSHAYADVLQHLSLAHAIMALSTGSASFVLLDDVGSEAYPDVQSALTQFLSDHPGSYESGTLTMPSGYTLHTLRYLA